MRIASHGVALYAFASLLGACSGEFDNRACTEIGCENGLTVHVTPAARWPHGAYRFVVEADGMSVTCSGSLPLSDCATRALACDREGVVTITESGCALPPNEHALGDLHLPGAPASVTVEIFRDEGTIARETFAPTYRTIQPNGPGCEPTCTQARVDLTLSFE
jgi:hypothetical protein